MSEHRKASPHEDPHDGSGAKSRPETSHPAGNNNTKQYVFTVNAATGEVVSVERLGPTGQHQAISDDEWATLSGGDFCVATFARTSFAFCPSNSVRPLSITYPSIPSE